MGIQYSENKSQFFSDGKHFYAEIVLQPQINLFKT